MIKRLAVLAVILLLAQSIVLAQGQGTRPITQLTRQTDDPHTMPSYLSLGLETKVFAGCFVQIDPEEKIVMELISDDGCDVYVDGELVLNCFQNPQHLPDPGQSVKRIPASGPGVCYGEGEHTIRVEYSNIIFGGRHRDIDGATLIAPGLRFYRCQDNNSGGNNDNGNNGVGNGEDPQPPGNPPPNDGPGTGPGDPGNQGGNSGNDNAGPKGNNGVGNGEDPQPPGNPPINDGPGTGPGNPGNKGGNK